MSENSVENVAGRMVLTNINGRPAVSFQGVGKYTPTGNRAAPPIRPIEDIKREVDTLCGGPPAKPKLRDQIVAAIKWVDGTVIDCVRAVEAWRSALRVAVSIGAARVSTRLSG